MYVCYSKVIIGKIFDFRVGRGFFGMGLLGIDWLLEGRVFSFD